MKNLTLKQLRYFEALADQAHFGRAADVTAISQPALSVQIRELETQLGGPLFERGGRSVTLTALGEALRPRIRAVLQSVDDLGDAARGAGGGLRGRLRLGIIPTIAPYLLPRLMGQLARGWPDLAIDIRETVTSALLRELSEGRIDCAIVALPIGEPAFTEVPLFSEPFVLVRPESDADRPMPGRDELREMRLLLLEEGHCFRDQALSFCDLDRAHTALGLDATSLSTLVQMVGAGMGVTLIPEMAVEVETRAAPVSVGRFSEPQPARTVGMIWRKTTPLAGALEEMAGKLAASV